MVFATVGREMLMRRGSAGNLVRAMAILAMGSVCGAAQPDYGYDWLAVGAPGSRHVNKQEGPKFFPPYQPEPMNVGAVGREYRMTQTQVNVEQWFEFVNAYWPYYDEGNFVSSFTGNWIWATNHNPGPGEDPGFYIEAGADRYPTTMSWRYAARYVNWLHNDKVTEQWAFENGVYDTSTFGRNGDGTITDQREHDPDAKFWIPTLDEWVKGMYYDPDRYGPGEEGYWKYPDGGQEPLISGYPWEGGETSAGIPYKYGNEPYLDVGSYPHVTSPWGFLDGSGAEWEWTEAVLRDRSRIFKGSRQFQYFPEILDRVDDFSASFPIFGGIGLRIASTIPAPPTFLIVVGITFINRRKRDETYDSESVRNSCIDGNPGVRSMRCAGPVESGRERLYGIQSERVYMDC